MNTRARFDCDECEGRYEHEIWCALNIRPIPPPEDPTLRVRREEEALARKERFATQFAEWTAGRVLISRVNGLDHDLRAKYDLYEHRDATVLFCEEYGLWYHGYTTIARQGDRITSAYGNAFDFYVLPDDPAAGIAGESL